MAGHKVFGAVDPGLQSDLDDLGKAVDDVANEFASLQAQISTAMTPTDVSNVRSKIQAGVSKLKGLLPTPTPTPPAPPAPPAP